MTGPAGAILGAALVIGVALVVLIWAGDAGTAEAVVETIGVAVLEVLLLLLAGAHRLVGVAAEGGGV